MFSLSIPSVYLLFQLGDKTESIIPCECVHRRVRARSCVSHVLEEHALEEFIHYSNVIIKVTDFIHAQTNNPVCP